MAWEWDVNGRLIYICKIISLSAAEKKILSESKYNCKRF